MSTATTTQKKKGLGVGAAIGLLTTVVALMLLAFLTPAINSGAHDLPLAVGGPAPAVAKVQGALEQKAPGTFDVTTYGTATEAQDAVKDRKAIGAITLDQAGVTITTATGAGAPYTPILKGLGAGLSAQGQQVTYVDVAPLPADDPAGTGMGAIGLPLIFGGMTTAMVMTMVAKNSERQRLLGAIGVAICGGLVAALILGPWFGAMTGNFFALWGAITGGMLAISLTVLGLHALLGGLGLGIGAVTMLFVSNPLSGLGTGWQWLPKPWGFIGQLMPVGAAGQLIRSVAYFGGHGMGMSPWVLLAWALCGFVLIHLGFTRRNRKSAAETAPEATADERELATA